MLKTTILLGLISFSPWILGFVCSIVLSLILRSRVTIQRFGFLSLINVTYKSSSLHLKVSHVKFSLPFRFSFGDITCTMSPSLASQPSSHPNLNPKPKSPPIEKIEKILVKLPKSIILFIKSLTLSMLHEHDTLAIITLSSSLISLVQSKSNSAHYRVAFEFSSCKVSGDAELLTAMSATNQSQPINHNQSSCASDSSPLESILPILYFFSFSFSLDDLQASISGDDQVISLSTAVLIKSRHDSQNLEVNGSLSKFAVDFNQSPIISTPLSEFNTILTQNQELLINSHISPIKSSLDLALSPKFKRLLDCFGGSDSEMSSSSHNRAQTSVSPKTQKFELTFNCTAPVISISIHNSCPISSKFGTVVLSIGLNDIGICFKDSLAVEVPLTTVSSLLRVNNEEISHNFLTIHDVVVCKCDNIDLSIKSITCSLSTPILLSLPSLRSEITPSDGPFVVSSGSKVGVNIQNFDIDLFLTDKTKISIMTRSFSVTDSVSQMISIGLLNFSIKNTQILSMSINSIGFQEDFNPQLQQPIIITSQSFKVKLPFANNPLGVHFFEFFKILPIILYAIDPIQSGRPPRSIKFSMSNFEVSIMDDCFESRLGVIFVAQRRRISDLLRREAYLEQKIKDRGITSMAAEELKRKLNEKESKLWIDSINTILENKKEIPSTLFSLSGSDCTINLLEQEWFKERATIQSFLIDEVLDDVSTGQNDVEKQDLLPLFLDISIPNICARIRNFEPLISCELFNINGPLIVGDSRTFLEQLVPVNFTMIPSPQNPSKIWHLLTNASPTFTKMYNNLYISLFDGIVRFSKSWQPSLNLLSHVLDTHSPPSVVSMPTLQPWDKLRLMLVGRPSVSLVRTSLFIGSSLSPHSWRNYLLMRIQELLLVLNKKNSDQLALISLSIKGLDASAVVANDSCLSVTPLTSLQTPDRPPYSDPFGRSPLALSPHVKSSPLSVSLFKQPINDKSILSFEELSIQILLKTHSKRCKMAEINRKLGVGGVVVDHEAFCTCSSPTYDSLFPIVKPHKPSTMMAVCYDFELDSDNQMMSPLKLKDEQLEILKHHEYGRIDPLVSLSSVNMQANISVTSLSCLLRVSKSFQRTISVFPFSNKSNNSRDLLEVPDLIRKMSLILDMNNTCVRASKHLHVSIGTSRAHVLLFNQIFKYSEFQPYMRFVSFYSLLSVKAFVTNIDIGNPSFTSLGLIEKFIVDIPLLDNVNLPTSCDVTDHYISSPIACYTDWRRDINESKPVVLPESTSIAIKSPKICLSSLCKHLNDLTAWLDGVSKTLDAFSRYSKSHSTLLSEKLVNELKVNQPQQLEVFIDVPQLALSDSFLITCSKIIICIANSTVNVSSDKIQALVAPEIGCDEFLWAEPESSIRNGVAEVSLFHSIALPFSVSFTKSSHGLRLHVPALIVSLDRSSYLLVVDGINALTSALPNNSDSESKPLPLSITVDYMDASFLADGEMFTKVILEEINYTETIDVVDESCYKSNVVVALSKALATSFLVPECSPFRTILRLQDSVLSSPGVDFCRIRSTRLPSVGGVLVSENFDVLVAPLDVRLTSLLVSTFNHFFQSDDATDDDLPSYFGSGSISTEVSEDSDSNLDFEDLEDHDDNQTLATHRRSIKESDSPFLTSSHLTEDSSSSVRRYITFHHVRVSPLQLRVSYKGLKSKNIQDFDNLRIHVPQLSFANKTLTWGELAELIKGEVVLRVLAQTASGYISGKISNVFRRQSKDEKGRRTRRKRKESHPLSSAISHAEEKKQLFGMFFKK
ncbi:hypothetical protein P9112_004890 [Eukaryota sp. TZLM1-RC]